VPLLILLVVVVVVVLIFIGIYNGLVRKRQDVKAAWAQIDVQLKLRYDLVPNLVETVKGYAAHERQTFEKVVEARSAAMNAQGVAAQQEAENFLTSTLKSLFALSEAYPDLGHRVENRIRPQALQRLRNGVRNGQDAVPGEHRRWDGRVWARAVFRNRAACRKGTAEGSVLIVCLNCTRLLPPRQRREE